MTMTTERVSFPGTIPQLCAAAGITYRQFDYYARRGFFGPGNMNVGSGKQRILTPNDVLRLGALFALLKLGLHLESAMAHALHVYPVAKESDS